MREKKFLISLILAVCIGLTGAYSVYALGGGNDYGLQPVPQCDDVWYMYGWSHGWEDSDDIIEIEAGLSLYRDGKFQGSHYETGTNEAFDDTDQCKHPTDSSYTLYTWQEFDYVFTDKDQRYEQTTTW